MAIQSFYISIELSEEEKCAVVSSTCAKRYKSDDLIYKDVLYIEDIVADGEWWHINAGLYDFFHSCEVLYEFCQSIEIVKPNFSFYLLGKRYEFIYPSLLDFMVFLYPKIKKYKENFEKQHGNLSVHPQNFFLYKRKNSRFFK